MLKTNACQGLRAEMGEEKVNGPVGERRDGMCKSLDLDGKGPGWGEELCW